MSRTVSAVLLLAIVSTVTSVRVPAYITCTTSSDCGTTECCVIGKARYSLPSCQGQREVGESCDPYSAPRNMSVSYPDGRVVELAHVYLGVCDCAPGLTCDRDSGGVCADPLRRERLNDLDE